MSLYTKCYYILFCNNNLSFKKKKIQYRIIWSKTFKVSNQCNIFTLKLKEQKIILFNYLNLLLILENKKLKSPQQAIFMNIKWIYTIKHKIVWSISNYSSRKLQCDLTHNTLFNVLAKHILCINYYEWKTLKFTKIHKNKDQVLH